MHKMQLNMHEKHLKMILSLRIITYFQLAYAVLLQETLWYKGFSEISIMILLSLRKF